MRQAGLPNVVDPQWRLVESRVVRLAVNSCQGSRCDLLRGWHLRPPIRERSPLPVKPAVDLLNRWHAELLIVTPAPPGHRAGPNSCRNTGCGTKLLRSLGAVAARRTRDGEGAAFRGARFLTFRDVRIGAPRNDLTDHEMVSETYRRGSERIDVRICFFRGDF
jgi:hypothetical protein